MSGALFLRREEVEELTGYRMPSRQIRWLREQGIPHWVAADGRPRVPRAAIEGAARRFEPEVEPDFSVLER